MRRVAGLMAVLVLVPLGAEARRVIVLDFAGDQDGRVREQMQTSLLQGSRLKVVPREELEQAVTAHNGYLGWTIKLEDARLVARKLGAGAIVTASVGEELDLRLFDTNGEPLWGKRLRLVERRLTDEQLQRLTAAIVVGARVGRKALAAAVAAAEDEPATPAEPRKRGTSRRRGGEDRTEGRAVAEGRASDAKGSDAKSGAKSDAKAEAPSPTDVERQSAMSEIAAARETAKRRREEADALEEQARAIARVEAERVAAQRRAAKIEKRLQEAAERYRTEVAQHEAELAKEREAAATRHAEAVKRRDEASRQLRELSSKPGPPARGKAENDSPPLAQRSGEPMAEAALGASH